MDGFYGRTLVFCANKIYFFPTVQNSKYNLRRTIIAFLFEDGPGVSLVQAQGSFSQRRRARGHFWNKTSDRLISLSLVAGVQRLFKGSRLLHMPPFPFYYLPLTPQDLIAKSPIAPHRSTP
jgi:hypothetical protein